MIVLDWINKGFDDLKNGHKTAFAKFSYTLKKRESEAITNLLDDKLGVKSWQSRHVYFRTPVTK